MFKRSTGVSLAIGALLCATTSQIAVASPASLSIQSFPKVPNPLREVQTPRDKLKARIETAQSEENETARDRRNSASAEDELRQLQNTLLRDFSFNWTSVSDNPQVDEGAADYRRIVDQYVASRANGHFDQLRAGGHEEFRRIMKMHYDNRSTQRWIDRQITFAENNRGVGAGDRTYNDLLILEVMLYGAVNLFPDNPQYATAKAKVDAVMAKYGGSRENATKRKDAEELAKARSVTMPPAIQQSSQVEGMFRTAWGTSGIPYTIRKINIRSNWAPKRNAYGVVIGQVRDAAIAVEDTASGKCYLYDFTMIKEGSAVRRSSHAAKRMACENIPK